MPVEATLVNIAIYPIKSIPGVKFNEWEICQTGLLWDRNYMLVNKVNSPSEGTVYRMMTLRQYPKMSLFETFLDTQSGIYTVKFPGISIEAQVKLRLTESEIQEWPIIEKSVKLFSWQIKPRILPCKAAQLFREALGCDCYLAYMGPEPRFTMGNGPPPSAELIQEPKLSLSDGFQILLANTRSLEDVNRMLTESGFDSVQMERFRPNLIVQTEEPWDEETWKIFSMGDNEYYCYARCVRCTIPNVILDEGKPSDNHQPLFLLREKHATDPGDPKGGIFGLGIVSKNLTAKLKIGMPIDITSRGQHVFIDA